MDKANLGYWRRQIQQDEQFSTVLKSDAFVRLKEISFLGAMDYAVGSRPTGTGSRAEHSLNVAALANYVATSRGYTKELKKHLILAGLLHDIGHAPLSHSVEPFIKSRIGYGHHQMGLNILQGKVPVGKQLHRWLSASADINFIITLVVQSAPDVDGGDLFSSPINIDTIEGVTRTLTLNNSVSTKTVDDDRMKFTTASFLTKPECAFKTLDKFWKLKHSAYAKHINSTHGLAADQLSQRYFVQERAKLNCSEVYTSEKIWKKRFGGMFSLFGQMKENSTLPAWLSNVTIKYTSRHYEIDESKSDLGRYICTKTEKTNTFPNRLLTHQRKMI